VEHELRIRKADGFALIDILFVCAIMGILMTIALPRLLLAKQSAGAASAIGSLRAIHSAQLTFALTCGGGFYAPDLTTLGHAPAGSPQGFISPNLATANTVTRSGYAIQVQGTPFNGAPGSCNGLASGQAAQGYKAAADPTDGGNVRYFATNVNGTIWENTSTLLGAMPEVGDPPAGHLLR
jgi:type II secretory pathway pseudopilin PulG